jgi:RNA polymerase sigma-70 factor (ECF subfamily)
MIRSKLRLTDMTDQTRNELFARHWVKAQPVVMTYLLTILRSATDAEDVLQSAALKAAMKIESYEPERSFISWVMAIARNEAIDHLRRHRRDRLVFAPDLMDQLAADAELLAEQMTDRKVALAECLEVLVDRSRRIVAMRYRENLSIQKIADRLSMTPNATYVSLHRIRQTLARCIEDRLTLSREDAGD